VMVGNGGEEGCVAVRCGREGGLGRGGGVLGRDGVGNWMISFKGGGTGVIGMVFLGDGGFGGKRGGGVGMLGVYVPFRVVLESDRWGIECTGVEFVGGVG